MPGRDRSGQHDLVARHGDRYFRKRVRRRTSLHRPVLDRVPAAVARALDLAAGDSAGLVSAGAGSAGAVSVSPPAVVSSPPPQAASTPATPTAPAPRSTT